jgi:hypothetical protein
MYNSIQFALFGTLMKWLLRLFKQVIVLQYVTFSEFFINNFFTSLHHDLKLTSVLPYFVHAECIMQHGMHVATLFCASTRCICYRSIQIRVCSRTVCMLLTVPIPCSVGRPHSLTPCQVGKYETKIVSLVISTRLTGVANFYHQGL